MWRAVVGTSRCSADARLLTRAGRYEMEAAATHRIDWLQKRSPTVSATKSCRHRRHVSRHRVSHPEEYDILGGRHTERTRTTHPHKYPSVQPRHDPDHGARRSAGTNSRPNRGPDRAACRSAGTNSCPSRGPDRAACCSAGTCSRPSRDSDRAACRSAGIDSRPSRVRARRLQRRHLQPSQSWSRSTPQRRHLQPTQSWSWSRRVPHR